MGINWARKAFHLLSSLIILLFALYCPESIYRLILLFLLLSVVIFEILRLRYPQKIPFERLWAPLLKDRERKSPSDALWFCLGLFLASLIGPHEYQPLIVLLLGLSDPSAEIIGRKFGKIKNSLGKSLEGSLGFALTSTVIASLFLQTPLWMTLLFFVLPITCLEYLTVKDNLWIPLASALLIRLLFH